MGERLRVAMRGGQEPRRSRGAASPHPYPPPLAREGVIAPLRLTTGPAYSHRHPGGGRDPPVGVSKAEEWGPGIRRDDDLVYGRAADYGDHRIAEIFDVFGQHAGLDRCEAGVVEVALDEEGVALIVEGAPDRHRLGREAAVREADNDGRAGAQRAPYLAQHAHRPLQVLDRDADHRRIEAGIGEGQMRVAVQGLNEPA